MSLHKSLKQKGHLVRRRNVLSRGERVQRLKEDERWEDGQSVFGLAKVKPVVIAAPTARPRKEEEAEGAEVEAAEGAAEQASEASESQK